jgi:guanylate kinase
MTTMETVRRLRMSTEIIWENWRYGSLYAIDRTVLLDRISEHIPVVHLGQEPAVRAVTDAFPAVRWIVVHFWCPRDIAASRLAARGDADVDARLSAWDATQPLGGADLSVNTAEIRPPAAALAIHGLRLSG